MPSVEHRSLTQAPIEEIWAFVRDMDNWAPLVTGYEGHTKLSETESVWHLRGELGGLVRTAEFNVLIEEWAEPDHVRFSLQGINEPVTGSGQFVVRSLDEAVAEPVAEAPAARQSLYQRIVAFLARWLINRVQPAGQGRAKAEAARAGANNEILFSLTLTASGMGGRILNALIAPMLRPVAEDLANRIVAAVHAQMDARRAA